MFLQGTAWLLFKYIMRLTDNSFYLACFQMHSTLYTNLWCTMIPTLRQKGITVFQRTEHKTFVKQHFFKQYLLRCCFDIQLLIIWSTIQGARCSSVKYGARINAYIGKVVRSAIKVGKHCNKTFCVCFQAQIKRSLSESGCPAHILNDLVIV